jgi:hypothetical protein
LKRTLPVALVAAAALGAPAASSAATPAPAPDAVVQWNQFLLGLQGTAGVQPATVHPTYDLALTHAAINDAVVSAEHRGRPYIAAVDSPRGASPEAAADAAAHDTLVKLYPSQAAAIDGEYDKLIADVPAGRHKTDGVKTGQAVARKLIARRSGDGSQAPLAPFTAGSTPGDYQLTPPAFGQPVFTHWPAVRPFLLKRASQFRPPAPPALTSPKYAAAIDEVQAFGPAGASSRTADQTQIGQFWNPPIWAMWNRVAQTAATGHRSGLTRDARTFATLNLTFADSVIAYYDAKYKYRVWRPVTAIRAADQDGNPATEGDPNWTPLSDTAPDPSYPGAHATVSAAGAKVLESVYGNDFAFTLTSPAMPGVERSFVSFSEAADEASVSRIYNGNHTRIDEVAGANLGSDVAGFDLR